MEKTLFLLFCYQSAIVFDRETWFLLGFSLYKFEQLLLE